MNLSRRYRLPTKVLKMIHNEVVAMKASKESLCKNILLTMFVALSINRKYL